jgi:hypothetical protein
MVRDSKINHKLGLVGWGLGAYFEPSQPQELLTSIKRALLPLFIVLCTFSQVVVDWNLILVIHETLDTTSKGFQNLGLVSNFGF